MTWRALTENYLKSIEGKNRPSTVQQLTRILRHDDLAAWRERPAVSTTADDVRAVRDHIHDDRGSPVQSTCVLRVQWIRNLGDRGRKAQCLTRQRCQGAGQSERARPNIER